MTYVDDDYDGVTTTTSTMDESDFERLISAERTIDDYGHIFVAEADPDTDECFLYAYDQNSTGHWLRGKFSLGQDLPDCHFVYEDYDDNIILKYTGDDGNPKLLEALIFDCDSNCAVCDETRYCHLCDQGEYYNHETGCCGTCGTAPTDMPVFGFDDNYEFGTTYDDTCDYCGLECVGNSSFAILIRTFTLALAALLI